MTEETMEAESVEETAAPEMPQLGLNLNDLALMANVIQVTADRGAIRANEMTAVGNLYTKLVSFVQAHVPPAPAPEIAEQNVEEGGAEESNEEE